MAGVAERYRAFTGELERELAACGRAPGSVTLVGVSKKQPAEAIAEAIAAGLRDVGENYVQEARAKFSALPPVRKHFIGHVQTNKAKAIAELFDVVQSVDRIEAGEALSKAALALGKPLSVLVQVNISPAERYGAPPAAAAALAERLRRLGGLSVDGVMAIGPIAGEAEVRRAFALAAKTLGQVGGSTLSIGMSGDWRDAVQAGSTMLRIGEALFGPRRTPEPQV